MFEAVKVALAPTPAQGRRLASHAGGARFAYDTMLAHVKCSIDKGEKPEWSFWSLRKRWNMDKDALAVDADGEPWWQENSKEAYGYGLESLAKGLSNWSKSRRGDRKGRKVGFPKFKSKNKETPKFAYTAGGFGLIDGDPKALRLPKIGRVHCMEDVAARVANQRLDGLHKLTTRLAKECSEISIEGLNVSGMVKTAISPRPYRMLRSVSFAASWNTRLLVVARGCMSLVAGVAVARPARSAGA